jgi:tRNA A37 threonylcarbamoyladenosine modification protein TsaB
MNEVYLGHYRRGEDGLPEAVSAERLHGMSRLEHGFDSQPIAAGFGWQRYPELLAANEDLIERFAPVLHPCARFLLAPGAAGLKSGAAIDPKALNPAYLRQKVAEKPASAP